MTAKETSQAGSKVVSASGVAEDQLGRGLDDLRISVIDRCNFRCTFCMPADRKYEFLPREDLLTFEEIERLTRIFVRLGVHKVRLTGGEPLLRRDIEFLVSKLASIAGIEDIALTTNGFLLAGKAQALADAGLHRVTVSVGSLNAQTFGQINGLGHSVDTVLEGIDAAAAAGLGPMKINTVVIRGVNDDQVVDIARYFKERRHTVRFIEFMDVGTVNRWDPKAVLSAKEILSAIGKAFPMEPVARERESDVALRYRYLDDGVEVGAIASITQPFCGQCSRARLDSGGSLFTCLFAASGYDLRSRLRQGASDQDIEELLRQRWRMRNDRYSEERSQQGAAGVLVADPKVEMFRIGG